MNKQEQELRKKSHCSYNNCLNNSQYLDFLNFLPSKQSILSKNKMQENVGKS